MGAPSGLRGWVGRYAVSLAVFVVLDALWLGVVANGWYAVQLGPLRATSPNLIAAVLFYAIFLAGLSYFVVAPAVFAQSVRRAAGVGAFFGLVTYATWDLTNLAVIQGFPAIIVPVDLAWGMVLSACVSAVTTWVAIRVPALR
ncbi:MAG TPA: DUF2177 family protein [Dermatophilaceae bacterium]|jgi:uncharacterized membrane protein|nr:DUF2177 family protein [Actinomycetales bacterium]HMT31065.1 DUF2177 family protein [Dermatophilaceae bacterium]HMT89853.1 DUF2177 family protein [Dermatophilaceae bacterium]